MGKRRRRCNRSRARATTKITGLATTPTTEPMTTIGAMLTRRPTRLSRSVRIRGLEDNAELHPTFLAIDAVEAKTDRLANLGLLANWCKHCGVVQLDLGPIAAM